MTPALWLERTAKLHPDRPALYWGTDLICDYAGFVARAGAIAGGLVQRHGIAPGDRVALFMSNRHDYLLALYGIWIAGAVAVPINCKLLPQEAAWMIADCAAKAVFCEGPDIAGLTPVAGIDIDGADYAELTRAAPLMAPVNRQSGDLAWLFYTSGTTGRPKGVMLSNANLMAMTQSYFTDVDTVTGSDSALYAAPMSHGAGLYNFVFVLRAARHVIPRSGGFDADEVRDLAARHGNLSFFAAPTMVRRLVSHAAAKDWDGSGIKTIVYGGGPMYLADILDAVARMGARFVQIYGQGESPMTITVLPREVISDDSRPEVRQSRLASVGVPMSSVAVRIADETGADLPPGETGEILVKGPPVMIGYWNNPEATAKTLKDGWLWTGDVGRMDQDGFVTLTDRSRDVIISGGTNIYPREVEEVLLSYPGVQQVSVVGAPDPEWGEQVVAFVVVSPDGQTDPAQLDAHCLATLARFKRPKRYVFLETLPQNAYGKVLKTELRELAKR